MGSRGLMMREQLKITGLLAFIAVCYLIGAAIDA